MRFFRNSSHFCLMLQKKAKSSKILWDAGTGVRKEFLLTHMNSWHHETPDKITLCKNKRNYKPPGNSSHLIYIQPLTKKTLTFPV